MLLFQSDGVSGQVFFGIEDSGIKDEHAGMALFFLKSEVFLDVSDLF